MRRTVEYVRNLTHVGVRGRVYRAADALGCQTQTRGSERSEESVSRLTGAGMRLRANFFIDSESNRSRRLLSALGRRRRRRRRCDLCGMSAFVRQLLWKRLFKRNAQRLTRFEEKAGHSFDIRTPLLSDETTPSNRRGVLHSQ